MGDREPVHVEVWEDAAAGGGADRQRALLVHGTLTWGAECFAEQRSLGGAFRVEVLDRRGYGGSPDTARSDYAEDADDIIEVLARVPGGAHLVGHSYGGVSVMLAAAQRPDLVRSLVLIEPSALRMTRDLPVAAAALRRIRAAFGTVPGDLSPQEYLTASTAPYGMPVPEFTPRRLRATRTGMRERPAWDAVAPLEPLATAAFPVLVLNGTWENAPAEHRAFSGDAMAACGAAVADRIGARHVRVPAAGHDPHRERPDLVNALLAALWSAVCPRR